jgi:hypothetical protein
MLMPGAMLTRAPNDFVVMHDIAARVGMWKIACIVRYRHSHAHPSGGVDLKRNIAWRSYEHGTR